MDSQQTPRTQNELPAGQKTAMVKQGPPNLANLQNHPTSQPQQQQQQQQQPQQYQPSQPQTGPPGSGPPAGPRFPPTNNGPTDGPPPRFPLQGGQPPPLRHLDSRSQLLPGGPQFPPPRPPYGPGGPPQRAPPPRNIFFGRPPPPGQASPSPTSGPQQPQRFPPPGPGQQIPPQFQGQPRPPPPPQLYSPQQQGFPNRPVFPPPSPGGDPRGPRPILQRTESSINPASLTGDPRLARPNYIPQQQQQQQPQQQQQQQISPQQQQLLNNWRGHLRQQYNVDRMADVEVKPQQQQQQQPQQQPPPPPQQQQQKPPPQQQRPPSNASIRSDEVPRPNSATSENGKSSDSESEGKKVSESNDNKSVEQQNNIKNVQETPKKESPNKDLNRQSPAKDISRQSPAKDVSRQSPAKDISRQSPAKDTSRQSPAKEQITTKQSPARESSKSSPIRENVKTPNNVEKQPEATKKVESRPPSSALEKSSESILQDLSAELKAQVPPKTPDSASIKGFDDGKRKSISSPIPPADVPVTNVSKKKTTTFAEQETPVKSKAAEVDKMIADRSLVSARTEKKDRAGMKMPLSTRKADAENDSGVDESTQRREGSKSNGLASSPTKRTDKKMSAGSPLKSPSKSIKSLPRTPEAGTPTSADKKKVPMNKVQVGAAPSPNLKVVRSKIGSLENATYKPGGGKVKIENRKLDFSSAQPKIAAKNDKYMPSGGDKKIPQVKLQWNAKSKIGSLENATYKPGGGDKKIESVKLDFKDKAKPKVGSKENAKHVPGGGNVKSSTQPPKSPQDNANNIETQKLDIKAESKIGSMDNMKHKPGGGDKKIFDDKSYLRQTSSNVGSTTGSGSQSPVPSNAGSISDKNGLPMSDENLNK